MMNLLECLFRFFSKNNMKTVIFLEKNCVDQTFETNKHNQINKIIQNSNKINDPYNIM